MELKRRQNEFHQSVNSTLLPGAEELKAAKLTSFDFFDTLVYRKSVSHYRMWKDISSFYFLSRAKAEIIARVLNRLKGIPEVSGSDIYDRLPKRWGLEFEIGHELSNLSLNPITVNLLKQAILSGGTVCIISDSHYREIDIKRFLNHLGIPEVKIFTSGERGLTKSTGLFEEIQKNLGVAYTDWIHIGDNMQSDILSSEKLGIKSFYYPPMKEQLIDSGLISPLGYKFLSGSKGPGRESLSRMFMNLLAVSSKGTSDAARMQFVLGSVMGDLCSAAIAEEIHNMHTEKKYDLILYSSRDGWLPFLAHKKMFPSDPVQYFKTSRKMLDDANFKNYLSAAITNRERILLFDLGWRGSTANLVSKLFPERKWDFIYWQLLGKLTENQIELNPGNKLNRLRIWRSRDFLECIFTDPSKGYDRIGVDLIPNERNDEFESEFKDSILVGANHGLEHHSVASSLKVASLILEAISRYPSIDLIKLVEGYSHQIDEETTGQLVVTNWKDLTSGARILWPYGSRLYSGNRFNRTTFTLTISLKEFAQRSKNLLGRLFK